MDIDIIISIAALAVSVVCGVSMLVSHLMSNRPTPSNHAVDEALKSIQNQMHGPVHEASPKGELSGDPHKSVPNGRLQ